MKPILKPKDAIEMPLVESGAADWDAIETFFDEDYIYATYRDKDGRFFNLSRKADKIVVKLQTEKGLRLHTEIYPVSKYHVDRAFLKIREALRRGE